MPTYVVTGVSRGLGFEFVRHLAGTEGNTVVGLARNKEATEKKVAEQLKDLPGKIHILTGDLDSYDSLKAAAEETAKLTGGAIDYLVANAAIMVTGKKFFKQIGQLGEDPEDLEKDLKSFFNTNVVGNVHLFNVFMPLILKGEAKKVILVSSGMSDLSFSTKLEIEVSPAYVISKAAANMAVAKFAAQYKKDGVLFISVCPGVIEPGDGLDMSTLTEAETAQAMGLFGKFAGLREDFKGPSPPLEAIQKVIKVWENASIEKGNSGEFLPSTGVPGQWV